MQIPATADDAELHVRNCSQLSEEIAKAKPSTEVLMELMTRTYPKQRVWITKASPAPSLTEIMSDFPLLKRSSYVSFISLELSLLPYFSLERTNLSEGLHTCKETVRH